MANYRTGRVNEEITRALSELLRTVKDPRVSGAFVSITSVDCSADLKNAKVFVSVMGEKRKGDAVKGLQNAAGYLRTGLARALNLRITPELKFFDDDSLKHGAHISSLMKQIETELAEADRKAEESREANEDTSTDADI